MHILTTPSIGSNTSIWSYENIANTTFDLKDNVVAHVEVELKTTTYAICLQKNGCAAQAEVELKTTTYAICLLKNGCAAQVEVELKTTTYAFCLPKEECRSSRISHPTFGMFGSGSGLKAMTLRLVS